MFGTLEFWSFGFVSDFVLRISDLCLCKMVIALFGGFLRSSAIQVDSHFSEGILNSEGSVVVVTLLSVSGSIRCT